MTSIPTSTLVAMAKTVRAAKDSSTLELTELGLELRQTRRAPGRRPAQRAFVFLFQQLATSEAPVEWLQQELDIGSKMIDHLIETDEPTIG